MKKEIKQRKFEQYKQHKNEMVQNNLPIKYIYLKKCLRPILRKVLWAQRMLNRQKVEFIHREIPKINCPIVFAVSHIGKWDFEIVNEHIQEHFHVIASDFINMTGNISGLFMELNGVIFLDVDSKNDRENSRRMMLKVLEQGDNMMIFPEGTWNLSENEIIRDIHFGAVDIALEKSAVIIPIAVEQYDRRFVVNIGNVYEPAEDACTIIDRSYWTLDDNKEDEHRLKFEIKLRTTQVLRDQLATLKYEIWEREGITKRKDIPYGYWSRFIMERWAEWPGYSMDEQIRNGCFPAEKKKHWEMLEQISQMRVSEKNKFLFEKK